MQTAIFEIQLVTDDGTTVPDWTESILGAANPEAYFGASSPGLNLLAPAVVYKGVAHVSATAWRFSDAWEVEVAAAQSPAFPYGGTLHLHVNYGRLREAAQKTYVLHLHKLALVDQTFQVKDENGRPVEGVAVWVDQPLPGQTRYPDEMPHAITDAQGTCHVPVWPNRPATVDIAEENPPLFAPVENACVLNPPLKSDAPVTLSVTTWKKSVQLTVVQMLDGKEIDLPPAPPMTLALGQRDTGWVATKIIRMVSAHSQTLENLAPGRYEIFPYPRNSGTDYDLDHSEQFEIPAQLTAPIPCKLVCRPRPRYKVTLVVVSKTATALQEAQVTVFCDGEYLTDVCADENGRFPAVEWPAGAYTLQIHTKGRPVQTQTIQLNAPREIRVAMGEVQTLKIRVVDGQGQAISSATLNQPTNAAWGDTSCMGKGDVWLNDRGEQELQTATPATVPVEISARDKPVCRLLLTTGAAAEQVITIPDGEPVIITLSGLSADEYRLIHLTDAQGRECASGISYGGTDHGRTILHALPGDYSVLLVGRGEPVFAGKVHVIAGGPPAQLTFTLPALPPATLTEEP